MNKIKMSDVFIMPVKKTPGGVMPFLKDNQGEVIFVGGDMHVDAVVVAINVYDANQKSISNLRSAVHNLATDGLKQDKRITELEAALLELIDTASQCDSWESFPSDALDDATAAAIGDNNETT